MYLINLALIARDYVQNLFDREEGQDFFEYLLIIAGISLVILVAAAITVPNLFDAVLEAVCEAIDGLPSVTIDCTTIGNT